MSARTGGKNLRLGNLTWPDLSLSPGWKKRGIMLYSQTEFNLEVVRRTTDKMMTTSVFFFFFNHICIRPLDWWWKHSSIHDLTSSTSQYTNKYRNGNDTVRYNIWLLAYILNKDPLIRSYKWANKGRTYVYPLKYPRLLCKVLLAKSPCLYV